MYSQAIISSTWVLDLISDRGASYAVRDRFSLKRSDREADGPLSCWSFSQIRSSSPLVPTLSPFM